MEEQVETCERECETTGGAIFCDGKFLNAGNVRACAAELAAKVDIHVDVEVMVDVDVDVSNGPGAQNDDNDARNELDDACLVTSPGSPRGSNVAL